VGAKGFSDGGNDADFGGAAVHGPAFGGLGRVGGNERLQGETL